jgi:hypothetical protein
MNITKLCLLGCVILISQLGNALAAAPPGFVESTIQLNAPPAGLAFDADGVLYALEGASFNDNEATLQVIHPDGTLGSSFPVIGDDPENLFVGSMTYDPVSDRLLISDNKGAGYLYAVDKNGAKQTLASGVANIAGIAVRDSGEIFVSTAAGTGGEVLLVNRETGTTAPILSHLGYGAGLAFDAGDLIVQDANTQTLAGRLQRIPITPSGGSLTFGEPEPLLDSMQSSAGIITVGAAEIYTTGLGGLFHVSGTPLTETSFDTNGNPNQFATAIAFDPGTQAFEPFSGPGGGRLAYTADFGFTMQDQVVTLLTPAQPGDYNGDGNVDAGDYSVWRGAFGTTNAYADGNRDGQVDAADYVLWRQYSSTETASAIGSAAIPEPSSVSLVFILTQLLSATARRRARPSTSLA